MIQEILYEWNGLKTLSWTIPGANLLGLSILNRFKVQFNGPCNNSNNKEFVATLKSDQIDHKLRFSKFHNLT